MAQLQRDPVFGAITRFHMFAGLTYSSLASNPLVALRALLLTRSIWVLLVAWVMRLIGCVACLKELRSFGLRQVRMSRHQPFKNARSWRFNAYSV